MGWKRKRGLDSTGRPSRFHSVTTRWGLLASAGGKNLGGGKAQEGSNREKRNPRWQEWGIAGRGREKREGFEGSSWKGLRV